MKRIRNLCAMLVVCTVHLHLSAGDVAGAELFGKRAGLFHLDNGLEIVIVPDNRAPVVTQMIWYHVGSADEPPGKSGIAHFLEHLMFKGTEKHPDGEFSTIIASVGGQENAFTSYDYTAYFQKFAKQHLPTMMALEADRMTNLVLTDDVVTPERNVVLEERASRTDNNPSAQLGEAMRAALYDNHHYGIPIIGWKHEIETLDRHDAIAFYNQHYRPGNATLIIAGDVNEQEVLALAKKHYGVIDDELPRANRDRPLDPPQRVVKQLEFTDARVRQESFHRMYKAPAVRLSDAHTIAAIDAAVEVLGRGTTSRLYQRLVVEQKIAVSAGAYFQSGAYDGGVIGVYGTPAADHSVEEMIAAIDNIIEEFVADGISATELADAKTQLKASSVFAQDDVGTVARVIGSSLTTGETLAQVQRWPQIVEAIDAKAAHSAAASALVKSHSVSGILRPEH